MATEYIERKDVIEAICNLCRIENDDCSYPRCTIINTVKNIHPVDVVERKRGHRGHWGAYDFHTVECSVCEFRIDIMKTGDHVLTHLNFCPNCGTDMRPDCGADMRGEP